MINGLGYSNVAPNKTQDNPDYDVAGYVAKYGEPDQSKGQHLTDEFKLPNHITFSNQSKYSTPETQGGTWQQGGENQYVFTPSAHNLKNNSTEVLAHYFANEERKGTFIQLPDGRLIEGTR